MDSLPVDEALPRLKAALEGRNAAVLVAPPGAGKTTRVPLALLDAPWLGGRKIVMQEPRRLAARAAARRMAAVAGRAGRRDGGLSRAPRHQGRPAHPHRGRDRRPVPADAAGRSRAREHRLRDLRRIARARPGDRPLLCAGPRGADRAARGPAGDRHVGDPRSRPGRGPSRRRAPDRISRPHVSRRDPLPRSRVRRPARRRDGKRDPRRPQGAERQRAGLPAGRRRDPPRAGAAAGRLAPTSMSRRSTATSLPPTRTAPSAPRRRAGARSCSRPRSPRPASPSRACAS